jgi:beta-glucanase (GH16 family)
MKVWIRSAFTRMRWFWIVLLLGIAACGGGSSSSSSSSSSNGNTKTPLVVLSHSASGVSAISPFTVWFDMSEDVGSSFTADDIALEGASKGAFTKLGSTSYSLLVTPPANAVGSARVVVAAGSFSNVAGTANSLGAEVVVAYNTTGGVSSGPPPAAPAGMTFDWSDEFDGSSVNTAVWNFDLGTANGARWGNNELQFYQSQNATVANGTLTIEARRESVGGMAYTSARLQTSRKKTFGYGRFEMRAKLPYSQGLWPAFWLLGSTCNSFNLYGGNVNWPNCGEIDIMEMIGGAGTKDFTTHGTVHFANDTNVPSNRSFFKTHTQKLSSGFNTYAIDWLPTGFTWYFNGTAFATLPMPANSSFASGNNPFLNQQYFILLNLAVGGQWPGTPDLTSVFPQKFEIDYVRFFKKNP